jgi:hypothetical protein
MNSTIVTPEEDLQRLVHPNWVVAGRLTSQAFEPTKKDNNQLSVNLSSIWSYSQSFDHHTKTLNLKADGIWCVSVSDCKATNLMAVHDPLNSPPQNPAHAYIDFSGIGSSSRQGKAKILRNKADSRGKAFPL